LPPHQGRSDPSQFVLHFKHGQWLRKHIAGVQLACDLDKCELLVFDRLLNPQHLGLEVADLADAAPVGNRLGSAAVHAHLNTQVPTQVPGKRTDSDRFRRSFDKRDILGLAYAQRHRLLRTAPGLDGHPAELRRPP